MALETAEPLATGDSRSLLIYDHLPYPAALTIKRLQESLVDAQSAWDRVSWLKDALEVTVRSLAVYALGVYLKSPARSRERDEVLLDLLFQPSTNSWVTLLGHTCRYVRDQPAPCRALYELFFTYSGRQDKPTTHYQTLSDFVEYRNTISHTPHSRPDAEYERDLREWLPRFAALLQDSTFLRAYPLVRVVSATGAEVWSGHQRGEVASGHFAAEEVERQCFGFVTSDGGFVSVEPFIMFLACEQCGENRLFVYEKQQSYGQKESQRRASMLEYDHSHLTHRHEPVRPLEERFSTELLRQVYRAFRAKIVALEPYLKDFDALVEQHADIVGRHFVHDRLQQFLATRPSGIFLITGEPGIGKTAFMANVVDAEARRVHFFYRHSQRFRSPDDFVNCVLNGLLGKYGIKEDEVATDPKARQAQLQNLLPKIAGTLRPGEREIIVIDALDEAETAADGSSAVQALPHHVPHGIYFVISSRSGNPDLNFLIAREDVEQFELQSDAPENREDAYTYVRQRLRTQYESETCRHITTLAEWNFLLLRLICDALGAGDYSPQRVTEFLRNGASVQRWYADYWERLQRQFAPQPERLEQISAVLGAITAAGRPITQELVCEVLGLGATQFEWCLRFIGQYLDTIPVTAEGIGCRGPHEKVVYRPYHASFGEFVRAKVHLDLTSFHRQWASLLLAKWRDLEGYEQEEALRHLPHHLIAARDWERLATLVRSKEFLQATAACPGTVVALENTYAMAKALTDAGDQYWSDLLACADAYCRFSEEIRNSPTILEDLIERGKVDEARQIIEKQPDAFLRGVLMLATAPIAEQASYLVAAAELQNEGATIVREKVDAGVDVGEWYSPETKSLVSALLSYQPRELNFAAVDNAETRRVLQTRGENAGVRSRTRLPLLFRFLAHVCSVRTYFYSGRSLWVAMGLLLYFVVYHVSTQTGKIKDFPVWVALPTVGLIAWQFGFLVVAGIAETTLKRMSERFDRDLTAVAVTVELLPEAERQRHYARLLRFFFLTRTVFMPPSSSALIAYWTAQRFQALRHQPTPLADLIADVSVFGGLALRSLSHCLATLDRAEARVIYEAVVNQALSPADFSNVLGLMVTSVSSTGDVGLFVSCLQRYRRLTDQETRKELEAQQINVQLLCCLSRADLGKAVLASMQRTDSPSRSFRERIVAFVTNFPFMEQSRFVVRSPLELTLAVLLITPYMVFFYPLLLIGVALFLFPLLLLVLSAGAPIDPYGLVTQCRGKDPAEIRRILAHWLRGLDLSRKFWRLGARITSGWMLAPAAIRYMRRTVVAQNILRGEPIDINITHRVLQYAISSLIGKGLFGRRTDVVLKVMDDRRLLAAAKSLLPVAGTASGREAPTTDKDGEQLDRVLPLRSTVVSFVVGIVLSGAITLLWLGALRLLFPGDAHSWLFPDGAVACLAGCVFLVVVQHTYALLHLARVMPMWIEVFSTCRQRLGRLPRRPSRPVRRAADVSVASVAVWYQVLMGIVCVSVLYNFAAIARAKALAAGLNYPVQMSDTPFLYLAVIATLTVKVLVPSVVARWRGSSLLYPTTRQLWLNRLWSVPQLAAGAIVLAFIAHWIAGSSTGGG